jgi:hypothetical protein
MEWLRPLLLSLPGVTEGKSYGTPGFFVNKRLFVRIREDGENLVVYTDERDKWMEANPAVYHITEHYRNYPWMLVRLVKVKEKELKILFEAAWRLRAGKKLTGEFDAKKGKAQVGKTGKKNSGPAKKK